MHRVAALGGILAGALLAVGAFTPSWRAFQWEVSGVRARSGARARPAPQGRRGSTRTVRRARWFEPAGLRLCADVARGRCAFVSYDALASGLRRSAGRTPALGARAGMRRQAARYERSARWGALVRYGGLVGALLLGAVALLWFLRVGEGGPARPNQVRVAAAVVAAATCIALVVFALVFISSAEYVWPTWITRARLAPELPHVTKSLGYSAYVFAAGCAAGIAAAVVAVFPRRPEAPGDEGSAHNAGTPG